MDVTDVSWDLSDLLGGRGEEAVDELLDDADARAAALATRRGQVAAFAVEDLRGFMAERAELEEVLGRAQAYALLRFATDTVDPARGALLQRVQERTAAIATRLVFFDVEWAGLDDQRSAELLAGDGLDLCRHHLQTVRQLPGVAVA